ECIVTHRLLENFALDELQHLVILEQRADLRVRKRHVSFGQRVTLVTSRLLNSTHATSSADRAGVEDARLVSHDCLTNDRNHCDRRCCNDQHLFRQHELLHEVCNAVPLLDCPSANC